MIHHMLTRVWQKEGNCILEKHNMNYFRHCGSGIPGEFHWEVFTMWLCVCGSGGQGKHVGQIDKCYVFHGCNVKLKGMMIPTIADQKDDSSNSIKLFNDGNSYP